MEHEDKYGTEDSVDSVQFHTGSTSSHENKTNQIFSESGRTKINMSSYDCMARGQVDERANLL
jgi:hypothetical protein